MDGINSIQYQINEEKRTVTALVRVNPLAVVEEGERQVNKSIGTHWTMATIFAESNMRTKPLYVGTAICHPEDKFDPEKGKKIAKKRAVLAYMRDRKAIVDRIASQFDVLAMRMNRVAEYHNITIEKLKESFKED